MNMLCCAQAKAELFSFFWMTVHVYPLDKPLLETITTCNKRPMCPELALGKTKVENIHLWYLVTFSISLEFAIFPHVPLDVQSVCYSHLEDKNFY